MAAYLLDEREAGVLIKVVAGEGEMLVKCSSIGSKYVVAVSVDAKIRRWLGLSDVLGFRT